MNEKYNTGQTHTFIFQHNLFYLTIQTKVLRIMKLIKCINLKLMLS